MYSGLSKAMKGDIVSLRSEVGEVGKRVVQLDVGQITRTSLFLFRTATHKIQIERFVGG